MNACHIAPGFKSPSALIAACVTKGGTFHGQFPAEKARRVLLASHELGLNGAPIVLLYLARSLRRLGWRPVLISPVEGPLLDTLLRESFPVLICPSLAENDVLPRAAGLFRFVVLNTLVFARTAAALSGSDTSVLWWLHEAEEIYHSDFAQGMTSRLFSNIKVYADSPRSREHLLRHRPGYSVGVLPFSVPDAAETAVNPFPLSYQAEGKRVFALVGTVERRKGQDVLLDAVRLLPAEAARQCFFVFVGPVFHADLGDKVRMAASCQPDRFQYIPQLPLGKLPAFYAAVDCVVCASRDDPGPVTVVEGCQFSKSVICSEHTGTAQILERDRAGLVYGGDDPAALAHCIMQILGQSAEDAAAMRESARSVYRFNFSTASLDQRLETEILPELLGGKPQVRPEPLHPAEAPMPLAKPLRLVLGVMNWAAQSHAGKGLLRKGLDSLRTNGFRMTWQKVMRKLHDGGSLARIAKQALFTEEELARQREHIFSRSISFSIVVPLYNTPERFLRAMIESVRAQTYAGWELCMADGSDVGHPEVEQICREYAEKDSRIRYRRLEKNYGISGNTNACLEMSTGDYIGLFDHDDLLHPAALHEVMRAIEKTEADFIYTDEATFHDTPADAYLPHFKPDFAPDNLRGNNYICHFTVFQRSLLDEVGLFDPACDGAQDHDMVLRLTEKAQRVAHIPEILYYWRAHKASVAENAGVKPYVIEAGVRAVEKQLARLGLDGKVEPARPGLAVYRTRYTVQGTPKVSILIPNCEHIKDLHTCLNSIFHKTTWPNYEIILVENNSTSQELFDYYDSLQREHTNVSVVTWEGRFNYSAINNYGARFCTGDYLLLLNNDTQVITPDWIQEMLMLAQRTGVGAVGAMLYYPDKTIQHAGVCLGMGGVAGHYHLRMKRESLGYMGRLLYPQDMSAVTAACMLLRREVWDKMGGLDEDWAVAFNDVDLCMRIRKAGYLVVWTPYAELIHDESKSRGQEDTPEKRKRFEGEVLRFQSRWTKELEAGDPYYNPNFTLDRSDFHAKPTARQYDAR